MTTLFTDYIRTD